MAQKTRVADLSTVWSFLERTQGAAWLNLRSAHEWGNTTFLLNLKKRLDGAANFRDTYVLLCRSLAEMEGDKVPELGSIGNTIYHLERRAKLRGFGLWMSRFKNARPKIQWRIILTELGLLTVIMGWNVVCDRLQDHFKAASWGWLLSA
jgi:hypothetical protein